MVRMFWTLAAVATLSACATTRATAEQRTHCERMAAQMGTGTTHDHSAMKGMPANPMNLTHEQCRQILSGR